MPAPFSPAALQFLRGLKRHNDRVWFNDRKHVYEQELKAPMLALIAQVNEALARFAPEHVRPPEKSLLRIYRDIRFSHDKRPYKHQLAVWFGRRGLAKTSGAGFYFHLSASEVRVAAGVFMPDRLQTLAIRRHLLEHHARYRALLNSFERPPSPLSPIHPPSLTRAPKGFPSGHPALDLILQTQWGAGSSLPAEAALEPGLLTQIVSRFKRAAPLVALLNAPLAPTATPRGTPLF